MSNPNPDWRTQKIPHVKNLRYEIDRKEEKVDKEMKEIAYLKNILSDAMQSELPILLYLCCYKDDDSGRWDYDHFYYLPDLKETKLDRVTRYVHSKGEVFAPPETLDLRKVYENCGFPESITSTARGYWELRQKCQPKADKNVEELESIIDLLFRTEEIESWEHLHGLLLKHFNLL